MFRYLLVPWWAAQLLTGAKSFMDNPLLGSRRLNELGLHTWRLGLADRMASARRRRLAHLLDESDRADFDRDGFVVKRGFLPEADFAALLAQVRAYRGEAREQLQGNTVTRRIACDLQTGRRIPALHALQRLPAWRGLISYAGSYDTLPMVYVQTVLSQVRPGDPDPQEQLHSDTFHATVKAWLFLTDVEPGEMCFTYVPGSHRLTPQRLAWERRMSLEMSPTSDRLTRRGSFRVEPEELPGLGLPPPVQFAVPANTLVVADTHGFHARGASSQPCRRVEVWAYGRRNPFLPWAGLDAWRLGDLVDRRVGLAWTAGDVLERLRIKRQVWRLREGIGAFDADQ
jgi:phytanoyl-CoA dioxygenase PhyH